MATEIEELRARLEALEEIVAAMVVREGDGPMVNPRTLRIQADKRSYVLTNAVFERISRDRRRATPKICWRGDNTAAVRAFLADKASVVVASGQLTIVYDGKTFTRRLGQWIGIDPEYGRVYPSDAPEGDEGGGAYDAVLDLRGEVAR